MHWRGLTDCFGSISVVGRWPSSNVAEITIGDGMCSAKTSSFKQRSSIWTKLLFVPLRNRGTRVETAVAEVTAKAGK
jgi:hypothetical protein